MAWRLTSETKYYSLVKWWLFVILLFVPFQHTIVKAGNLWSPELAVFLDRLEEFTIIIFSLFAAGEMYRKKDILNRLYLIMFFPVFALIVAGIISGTANGNSLLITLHGTFDYVKYFFVIFIYAAFFREPRDFKRVFKALLILAVFMGAVAFIQEAWALTNRYILQENIHKILYLDVGTLIRLIKGKSFPLFSEAFSSWRIGIYRTSSLMINHNYLGLYCILILAIYIHVVEKTRFPNLFLLFAGIFGSVSRVTYLCFTLLGGIQVFKGKKLWIVSLVLIATLLFYLSPLPEKLLPASMSKSPLSVFDIKKQYKEIDKKHWDSFRSYTREKAFEIWKDHILFGVGPGMYGGGISVKYKSPVYEKYNFNPAKKLTLEEWQTIDQFWPQVAAELGIFGIICFAWFFISLAATVFISKNKASSNELKGLFIGLGIYIVVILFYTIGYSLNIPPILFTYFAFLGIGLSCVRS